MNDVEFRRELDRQDALIKRPYAVDVRFHVDADDPSAALDNVRYLLAAHGLADEVSTADTHTVGGAYRVGSWVGTRLSA
jgi:hypothetical protein